MIKNKFFSTIIIIESLFIVMLVFVVCCLLIDKDNETANKTTEAMDATTACSTKKIDVGVLDKNIDMNGISFNVSSGWQEVNMGGYTSESFYYYDDGLITVDYSEVPDMFAETHYDMINVNPKNDYLTNETFYIDNIKVVKSSNYHTGIDNEEVYCIKAGLYVDGCFYNFDIYDFACNENICEEVYDKIVSTIKIG